MNRLFIPLIVLASLPHALQAAEPLPIVRESVDEIILLEVAGQSYRQVIFLREECVLATRVLLEDKMLFTVRDGEYLLAWNDYDVAIREVTSKRFSVVQTSADPFAAENRGPWWSMARNMRDLRLPEQSQD
ncbi:MAG: hypothetical protein N2C14_10815 [Planctomycetales bacterium]